MHSQHLDSTQTDAFEITADTELFTEAGISPNGVCWVVPTDVFLRIWESPVSAYMKARGFRLRNDGKLLGAPQACVLVLPSYRKELTGI